MRHRPLHVLFLCTGNSARSILAEQLLNHRGQGRFRAFSAGSKPTGTVHPRALELLFELKLPTAGLRSKGWQEFAHPLAPEMDFVITVCDAARGETCPVWPGRPITEHWSIEDPARTTGTAAEVKRAFRLAFEELDRRIRNFMDRPPQGNAST